jgi:hypothetical protein
LPKGFGVEDVTVNVNAGLVSGRDGYGKICDEKRRIEPAFGVGDHGAQTHRHFLFLRHISQIAAAAASAKQLTSTYSPTLMFTSDDRLEQFGQGLSSI